MVLLPLTELTLEELALDRCFFETFAEKVLGGFTTSVTAIAHNRYNHVLILLIFAEDALETIRQVEEFLFV